MKSTIQTSSDTLRAASLKATPGRIALIEAMAKDVVPRTVREIQEALSVSMNEATLYRALEALREVGIVSRVEFNHGHAHYELTHGKEHHHHLVCTSCSKIEDLSTKECESLAKTIARRSKNFASISTHSMELFGICNHCAK